VKYLLDTDHITILQRQSGREYAILSARIRREPRSDLGRLAKITCPFDVAICYDH
jgi:hypothetical protein